MKLSDMSAACLRRSIAIKCLQCSPWAYGMALPLATCGRTMKSWNAVRGWMDGDGD